MPRWLTLGIASLLLATAHVGTVHSTPITVALGSGISFQNEVGKVFTAEDDVTELLRELDGVWAPQRVGTVDADYYATGKSARFFDAVWLHFDVSGIDREGLQSASLRFYAQKGDYVDTSWNQYEVLLGVKNMQDEDAVAVTEPLVPTTCSFATGPVQSLGDGLAPNQTVGWVETGIDLSWMTSDSLDLTLRLWNVRLDAVELRLEPNGVPPAAVVPEPGTLLLLGSGLIGAARFVRARPERR
ncbi:MAG: PEP-CTERM sorting domain-containing protein [Thermodesulfobacteriota bacterium]